MLLNESSSFPIEQILRPWFCILLANYKSVHCLAESDPELVRERFFLAHFERFFLSNNYSTDDCFLFSILSYLFVQMNCPSALTTILKSNINFSDENDNKSRKFLI